MQCLCVCYLRLPDRHSFNKMTCPFYLSRAVICCPVYFPPTATNDPTLNIKFNKTFIFIYVAINGYFQILFMYLTMKYCLGNIKKELVSIKSNNLILTMNSQYCPRKDV